MPPSVQLLQSRGIAVRKTIDTLIATSCIEKGLTLLYSDKDFDPFAEHLGPRTALPGDLEQSKCNFSEI